MIWCVDDDSTIRDIEVYPLEQTGFQARGFADGASLLEALQEEIPDLIVLDIDQPNMHPVHNMVNNLVYSASGSDIVLTMADGKVLYRDGEYMTIDLERTLFEVQKETETILHAL